MSDDAPKQEAGFEIEGRFYKIPDSFRLCDPVLVTELTGMTFKPEFIEAINDPDRRDDPAVLVGLIGVAVWQGNPRWKREKVVAYVQQIDFESLESVRGDDEDEEAKPDVPPAEPAIAPAPSDAS